ncbi:hypothetical protein [Agaribacterium haliotis]|uniref:hypothetical protein n=1 Tax=Agaribacterium haliotis TaxID=2013869 RepID=UPI0011784BE0|nr:hypothetical protein [Agaribacterium haliotis]
MAMVVERSVGVAEEKIVKSYANRLLGYEVLPDEAGVILLEPTSHAGAENAIIYGVDGAKLWQLPFPPDLGKGQLFDRVGISQGDLVVIGIINGRDVKFTVDYINLRYIDASATR